MLANAAQIKQRYLNPTCNTMMLIAGLTDYVKRRQAEVGVRITQRTADKYERLLRYLKQYLAQRGKAEDIPVERMNYEFLDGFNLFLQTAHRCRHNGSSRRDGLSAQLCPSTACATNGLRKTRSATTNSKRTRCRPKSTSRRMNWNC
ncbi:MAG: phage integrase SAM-like domain-containing protein [Alistipes communis]